MIGQKLIVNMIIKQVIKAIKKASDKEIASDHEKRIVKLEKDSHPPQEYVCCKDCGCRISKTNNK
tara:strand:+ start:508 stop:702 length:195 start_codon:yes stop_codon:yes gene_type:complete